ncbi:MAG: hypothetical protein NTZ16_06850 [Verrucomicrobia bacterium]|nr:hypothetical protein [Verrucomicrobiota bacterium]
MLEGLEHFLGLRRAEEEDGGRGGDVGEGFAARGFLVADEVVAEAGEEVLAEVEVGVFLLGGSAGGGEGEVQVGEWVRRRGF